MKHMALAAVALATLSGNALAATEIAFAPGAPAPAAGQTVVYDFDTTTPLSLVTGPLVQIKSPPADANGAPPASSSPSDTNYLSVLRNGLATILFDAPVSAFSFDWGSIDGYNTLTILPLNEDSIVVPGTSFTNTPANGDQVSPGTNGRFSVTGTMGTLYLGFIMTSADNSFEIDNVSIPGSGGIVPEPATWAMMIGGIGLVGGALRRRRSVRTALRFA